MIGFSSGSVAVSIVMPPASGDPRNTKRAVPAIQNGILLPKIVLTYCEKKNSSDREKLLKFEAEGQEFANKFEITRTIYSNNERSEQF